MIEILMAIAVVVGVAVAADLLLTFAVIRRLAALESRTRQLSVATPGGEPAPGHQVKDFSVAMTSGRDFSRADLADGPAIVFFVMPTCEPCKEALADLRALPWPLPSPLYVLVASTDPDASVTEIAAQLPPQAEFGIIATIDDTTRAFGIDGFPTALAIEGGIVRANEMKVGSLLALARR
ncbi:MAG TPA: redoxin domain-containing protein [Streptosporangiaceae bacterium]|nr:redoxin domain-containing protein [Streptosporangiaceae bacterium]